MQTVDSRQQTATVAVTVVSRAEEQNVGTPSAIRQMRGPMHTKKSIMTGMTNRNELSSQQYQ